MDRLVFGRLVPLMKSAQRPLRPGYGLSLVIAGVFLFGIGSNQHNWYLLPTLGFGMAMAIFGALKCYETGRHEGGPSNR